MQSHINTDRPLEGDSGYITAVRKFSSELGLEIHCTEMDVVLGRGATMESQGQYLKSLFSALLRGKEKRRKDYLCYLLGTYRRPVLDRQ